MKDVGAEAVETFKVLESELESTAPNSVQDAHELAASVLDPASADAESAWGVLWHKPLFANAHVSSASAWEERLRPWMKGAWKSWGCDSGPIRIEKVGKRARRSSFAVRGDRGKEILDATRIAPHRLYAIQGAAIALRERAARSGVPYEDLGGIPVPDMVRRLDAEMGYGWGPITVMHFLTELGLACKPDIHLVRAARHLGLPGSVAAAEGTASLREALAINEAVGALVTRIYGTCTPRHLRYVDKVLMEISKQGLLGGSRIVKNGCRTPRL